jgi:hypothetical protein
MLTSPDVKHWCLVHCRLSLVTLRVVLIGDHYGDFIDEYPVLLLLQRFRGVLHC